MAHSLQVMKESVIAGMERNVRSASGLTGGDAWKMSQRIGSNLMGDTFICAMTRAIAVSETNACMGRIVAAPTAGSCGILPGALLSVQEQEGFSNDELVMALFAAAGFGRIIALQATISGAEGGCQAECGAAAGMAAAALAELYGGTPEMAGHACSFALMNMLGLVCDPVHGLVEVPCVYRNVGGVSQARSAAQMALSGIVSPMPSDEMILAMKQVGDMLPACLRETGEGGCAACRSVCGK
jgi:L-serine dehydratase